MSSAGRVLVIGAGLAGIAAALDCAAAGADVTLLEVRRRLGGAAYSVLRDGLHVDNGQHVFLRGCHAYRGLLHQLGSEQLVSIQPRLEIPILRPGCAPYLLRRGRLHPPLHLAGALARYPHLSPGARLSAARAALALMRISPEEIRADRITIGAWLERHGQGPEAIAALWDLIALPTLNLPAAQASLALGAFVFRRGLLTSAADGDIGFHVGTLEQIIGLPAERALGAAGVDVRLGWPAEHVRQGAGTIEVESRSGDGAQADTVIVAVPPARAAGLLEPLLPETAGALRALGSSPIVNLHVVYDRQVCELPFAAGVGTPVQYVFDRTRAGGAPPGCQYLAVSLSAAEREMAMSVQELREAYLPALQALLPRAQGANVEAFLVTREHAATFRAVPGVQALRPGPRTRLPGLVLAGTWTATGWPATLESAVLSGRAAARVALAHVGLGAGRAPGPAPLHDGPHVGAGVPS